jgi:uncharacterized protein (TIGR02246 family)
MKTITISAFLILLLFHSQNKATAQKPTTEQNKTEAGTTKEQSAIRQLLLSYRNALNASDVPGVLALYTKDGVFMPAGAPTASGREQVKASYEFVFKAIQIHIEFFIEEIAVSGDYAYVTTNSKGTSLINASGQTVPEENRELFVFQKENGQWKISRYMFNKTK